MGTGGEAEKKKKKKKRKNPSQSVMRSDISGHSAVNIGNDVKNNKDDIRTEAKNDSGTPVKDIGGLIHKDVPEGNTQHANLKKIEEELEEKIVEESVRLDAYRENVKDIIDRKSTEIKNLDFMIVKSQDEKNMKLNEVDKLDNELLELETKLAKLKSKKTELIVESKNCDKRIHEYTEEKDKLENDIGKELEISKEKSKIIEDEIQDLKTRLQETKELIRNLPDAEKLSCGPNKELIEFIENQIVEKEKELECPVCLEVACSPIFMCSEQHLICSTCRPKLSNCPECRVGYREKNRRHRYAEKTAEELERLKIKKDQIRKFKS